MAKKASRDPLTRDRILEAAFARIDRDGLGAFSLRGLASDVGVEPMSLYHWFPSKGHLFDALMDRWAEPMVVPGPEVGDWVARLRATAGSFRAAALARPAFFPYAGTHRFNLPRTLQLLDDVLAVFATSGAPLSEQARMFRAWSQLLVGILLDETNGYAKGPGSVDPPSDEEVVRRWPHVVRLGPFNRPEEHEANFWFAMDAMLAAFRDRVEAGPPATSPAAG